MGHNKLLSKYTNVVGCVQRGTDVHIPLIVKTPSTIITCNLIQERNNGIPPKQ